MACPTPIDNSCLLLYLEVEIGSEGKAKRACMCCHSLTQSHRLGVSCCAVPWGGEPGLGRKTAGASGMPTAAAVLMAMALADLEGFRGCHPMMWALSGSIMRLTSSPPAAPTPICTQRYHLSRGSPGSAK